MLLKLSGRALRSLAGHSERPFIARMSERSTPECDREACLADADVVPAGFRAVLYKQEPTSPITSPDSFILAPEFHYLAHGDVVRIDPARGAVTTLYRRNSPSNSFLVTERCDNYCVMCSQPPKERDDSWLVDEIESALPLIDRETQSLGITGGEPSLLGERLVRLLGQMKSCLPATAVHVLSNGRGFKDEAFARAVGSVQHPDLMIGIPLYSDVADEHDFVVQARGAFDDTLRGIMNLKRHGVRVEIRFVIHGQTYRALPTFAEFVVRNLLFVDHIALMGLEQMGFARSNLDALWIDPLDYMTELAAATRTLTRAGLNISLYNHQLCVLPEALHAFARCSISDWKNAFIDECIACTSRDACGGFFASSTQTRSRGIHAL